MITNAQFKTVVICSFIILGICGILWNKIFFVFPAIFIFLIFALYKKYLDKIFALVAVIFFVIACLYTMAKIPKADILTFYEDKEVILEGIVNSLPTKSVQNRTKFSLKTDFLTDENGTRKEINANTLVFLDIGDNTPIKRGDYLNIKASILVPEHFSNEGEFDYGKYLANSNIFTLSFVKELKIIDNRLSSLDKVLLKIDKIREKIILEHKRYLPEHKMQILSGVVFGSEAIKLDIELKNRFIESGLYHLLAASGMNVAFIFGIWFFILNRLRIPYKAIIISGGLVVIFYALMTGLPPSVIRATWMLELALFGKLIDRTANNGVILLFVCTLLLIYNPLYINDIGFLLSFLVTFGLITCIPPLMDSLKVIPAKISSWFLVPLVAQVFAMPIQIYYFQTVSLYSVFANMLTVPFMAIISFCGFISSILALIPVIGTKICFILDKINEPFLTFVYFIAEKFSSIPNNLANIARTNSFEILTYYILVFLLVYIIRVCFKNKKANLVALLLFIFLACSTLFKGYTNDLTITFLNVGEADSIFIRTPNDKRILVDTGRLYGRTRNSGSSIIVPFLKVNGINHLDIMLLTHPDTDHIAGSVDILKNIKTHKIITNGDKSESKTYLRLMDYLKSNNIEEFVLDSSQEISPDKDVSIVALKAKNESELSHNDTSIILFIKYKDFDGILMGDSESNSFYLLKENLKPNGKVELFKVGHHGSSKSVNQEMADFIAPEISIISVGENHYGHPDLDVLDYLSNSKILRTDIDKAIRIKSDGFKYSIYNYNYQKSHWDKKNN